MNKFKLTANYPALPKGYSFRGFVENDDPSSYWLTVKLRRDVKVLGMTLHFPLASTVDIVSRNNFSEVPFRLEDAAERLAEKKLGLRRF